MRCKLYITFLAFVAVLFSCCHKKSEVFSSLETADSLLSADCDSLAAMFFYQLDMPEDTTEELAYYNYVASRINCRNYEYQDPEVLDLPIAYFKQTGDSKRLAYSYCYKSIFLVNYSYDLSSAMIYNKMAEEIANNLDDDILKYNIYSNGYTIAAGCFDTQECLSYAMQAYHTGEKMHEKSRLAYPANYITMCYNDMNMSDSVQKYMSVCLNLIDCYNMGAKASVYASFGDAMFNKDNFSIAEQYYLESVGIIENADAFKGLTKIYLSRGNLAKAKECYAKALRPDAYESNIDIMSVYAGYLERSGDLASASSVYRRVSVEKDSLYRVKERNMLTQMDNLNRIFAEQKSDSELLKSDINRLKIWLIVCAVLTAALAVMLLIRRAKVKRESVSLGAQLYERLLQNENISQWSKDEREIVSSYYFAENPAFGTEVTNGYQKLSVNANIFLILHHLGKSKTEVMDIMGFSDQAYRSLKSRIEKMRKG